ncbi:MAG: hypothetical protein ACR2KV_03785 [Solirubrobacteraceae bacterium]
MEQSEGRIASAARPAASCSERSTSAMARGGPLSPPLEDRQENSELSPSLRSQIASRCSTLHSYTLFTGYFPRRIRGEQRSFQVLGPQ